jgi:hypothetical protein
MVDLVEPMVGRRLLLTALGDLGWYIGRHEGSLCLGH